jgi:hypothetical protein
VTTPIRPAFCGLELDPEHLPARCDECSELVDECLCVREARPVHRLREYLDERGVCTLPLRAGGILFRHHQRAAAGVTFVGLRPSLKGSGTIGSMVERTLHVDDYVLEVDGALELP